MLLLSPKMKTEIEVLNMSSDKDTVSIREQVKNSVYKNDSITFNYELNDKAAKNKMVKGSKRIPFEVEKIQPLAT